MSEKSCSELFNVLDKASFKAVEDLTLLIFKYKTLLKDTKNTNIISESASKLFKLMLSADSLIKSEIIKLFRNKKIKNKISDHFDPLIYKTEILNYIRTAEKGDLKYFLKFFAIFVTKFISDYEIITEIIFLDDPVINNLIFHIKPTYYDIYKNVSLEFSTEQNIEKISKNYMIIIENSSINQLVSYIQQNNDKYVLKILAKYPALSQFYNNDPSKIRDEKFLTTHEAKKLFKNNKIFIEKANIAELKIVNLKESSKTNTFHKYLWFRRCIENEKFKKAKNIIKELKDINNLSHDIKLLFTYFYDLLDGDYKESQDLVKIYGLDEGGEYKFVTKMVHVYSNATKY
ncbi:hypothetical protein EDEG_02633 [Edhazardia aedis USNM 41457]|uniref:Uncharacterized protein n=1 Tax=Edhazardia aedis (strain USNM 41457) TaxID=1003232 RepID=J9D623_EDHAE|nr:hypothetical protein EDEG_02633 [Edhazardia aedis USNM 41457]|eukprot:EJW02989.1 hypothetical protein EDEG_02633 [Edhazardia aedis USNM 41457]